MIAIGFVTCAFVGAVLRALVTDLDAPFDRQLWGTLIVNVAGSFLLGLLHSQGADSRVMIGVGGLGALTTFSTLISQVECIHREDTTINAALYLLGSVILGVGAGWIGWILG